MERQCLTGAFLILASIVALVSPAGAISSRAAKPTAVATGIVRQINTVRAAQSLGPLHLNVDLEEAARAHSVEMASRGYFAHHSANGGSFASRVRRWYAQREHWAAGENLGWATPEIASAHIVQLWLASPEHRANILDPSWHDVGCSVVHAHSAPGVFDYEPVTVITCDFGVRS